jgi:hypothetical protein
MSNGRYGAPTLIHLFRRTPLNQLKLRLDDLQVDTFQTTSAPKQKGTVFGEQCTCYTQCGQNTCPGCPTCDASCNGSCGASCNGTCDASCNGTCDDICNGTGGTGGGFSECDYTCYNGVYGLYC